jgi:hypothetical protein
MSSEFMFPLHTPYTSNLCKMQMNFFSGRFTCKKIMRSLMDLFVDFVLDIATSAFSGLY